MPEDHCCPSIQKRPGNAIALSSSTEQVKKNAAKSSGKSFSGKKQVVDPTNTVRGTSERRQQQATSEWSCSSCTSLNAFSDNVCHICQTRRLVMYDHNDDNLAGVGTSSAPASTTYSGNDYSCPICSARYSDPVDLIAHVDNHHSGAQQSNPPRTPTKNSKGKCICS